MYRHVSKEPSRSISMHLAASAMENACGCGCNPAGREARIERFACLAVEPDCGEDAFHRVVALRKKGADHAAVKRIYSHPQALGQCARYLNTFFPEAELIATASTSAAVAMVRTPADAGIVGPLPVGDKFELSPCTISDEPRNYTQFLLVERGTPDFSRPSEKVFLSFSCLHRPGSLIGALSAFASAGINMTRIESRPIKDRRGEYRFFVEIEADASLPQTQSALRSLEDMCSSIKILGCY